MANQYTSLEDIDREFGSQIDREEDPVRRAELRVQAAQAKVAFKEQESNAQLVGLWKQLALVEYPKAATFPELVTGNSEEEVRQSAQQIHDRVTTLQQGAAGQPPDGFQTLQQRAQDLYGRSPSMGGGAQSLPTGSISPDMQEERWRQRFAQQYNDAPRDIYGQKVGLSPSDIDRFVRGRFTSQVGQQVRFWSDLTSSAGRRW